MKDIKDLKIIKELGIDLKNTNFNLFASDEVGRGCLAGPVVTSTVLFSGNEHELNNLILDLIHFGIDDSKKISEKKRNNIIKNLSIELNEKEVKRGNLNFFYFIDVKDSIFIDNHNILNSTLISMEDGVKGLSSHKNNYFQDIWLIDGNQIPKNKIIKNTFPIVKGDSKSKLIAIASIIAKNYRDELMNKLDKKYQLYNLKKNKGYGTKEHRSLIEKHGLSEIHRKSFKLKK